MRVTIVLPDRRVKENRRARPGSGRARLTARPRRRETPRQSGGHPSALEGVARTDDL
jgi:hypothetical protein